MYVSAIGNDMTSFTHVNVQEGTDTVVESTIGDGSFLGNDVDLFFYGGQQIALQTDESGNDEHHYLHDPAIDMILADEDATGEVLWTATDHLGSVTTLVDFDGTSDTDADREPTSQGTQSSRCRGLRGL